MASLTELSDQEIAEALREHGSIRAAARKLDVGFSTLHGAVTRRGIEAPTKPTSSGPAGGLPRRRSAPQVTRESLQVALEPPNTCQVHAFLESLDADSREIVEEAISYNSRDFSANSLRQWLLSLGFQETAIPSNGSVTDHRNGRRPCRCQG